jgi:hypothetical protein
MKKVILLALLMPLPAFGQIIENFESESIVSWTASAAGRWKADTTASLSGRFSLHHIYDNPDAGTDQIGIRAGNLHPSRGTTRWSFLVRYGYDPSSLNNWSFFLMSDNSPESMSPDGEAKGFAVGVNLTGSDDTLRLWKVDGSLVTAIVNCRINWQADIGTASCVRILVERSADGNWTVSVSSISGSLITTTSGLDKELFTLGWIGVYYRYSSTRDQLLWLDDINVEGIFYEDKEPPAITQCKPSGKKSVELILSEIPAEGIMVSENISLNDEGNKPVGLAQKNSLTYSIEFKNELNNRSLNTLKIEKLCDISGNCSQNITIAFTPVWAVTGDVIISEIMADPAPEVSLPGKEFIEITNRTGYSFNLKNWKLSTGNQDFLFPETNLPASGIAILCISQDTSLFQKFGKVIGLKQFPSLTDAGRLLFITDSMGTLIHGVEYISDWYKDDLKSNGGWSLEMVDSDFPFCDSGNWKVSASRNGGTPGAVNSVSESNPDITFFGIQNAFPTDSATIHLRFSEPAFDLAEKKSYFRVGGNGISDIYPADPLFREYEVKTEGPLHRNELYQIEITAGINDFAGNLIQKSKFNFGLTEPAQLHDILFNEILFNPLPGDPDFLELFNTSGKVIDASRLQLMSVNDASGDKSEAVPVSDEKRCLLPGEYYAITTDRDRISERYYSCDADHLFVIGSLPSMPDDKGHLILYNRELDQIDELVYTEEMHYPLLATYEGVALEKTDPAGKSEEKANWHSASETSGWGTPGAPNSIFNEVPATSDNVELSSSKISPDNDGYEDLLTITINLTGNGNVVSVTVFDEAGNYVRKIAANLFSGVNASIVWDGTADDGSLVRTGIYIILINLFDDTGKTKSWKKICTVIRN